MDEIRSLAEINKQNSIQLTNVSMNLDHALDFYSRYSVYKKCELIFTETLAEHDELLTESSREKFPRKNTEHTTGDTHGVGNVTSRITFDLPSESSRKQSEYTCSNNLGDSNKGGIADLGINSMKKLDEYLDVEISKIEIPRVNNCKIEIKI
jgi:hypothetical protein